jgi:hypothetical protein
VALSRRISRLQNTGTFYVESETSDDQYYFVKYNPSAFEWRCLCKDNSTRGLKCKHIFAIEFAIQWGTLKDIDKTLLPPLVEANKRYPTTNVTPTPTKLYLEDDYDF